MNGSIEIPELYLCVGHGYFTAFCTRAHKFLFEKMNFDLSSDYCFDPQTSGATHPYGPHIITYGKVDLDNEEPHHQWYRPEIANPTVQSRNSYPKPATQVTWSNDTNTPLSSGSTPSSKSRGFQFGMDLIYHDGMGKIVELVYKGSSADSLIRTIHLEDGSNIQINDNNLHLIYQPDFSNLPKTPLDYGNEADTVLPIEDSQALA